MRRMVVLNLIIFAGFVFEGMAFAQTRDDIDLYKICSHCGMNRGSFDFSRMLIEYADGTIAAGCSSSIYSSRSAATPWSR